ncbi:MAG: ribosomal protein S18-alanine N-acetyltransferase [Clostridia bacterium]|nr:ribosomal protein S18-alanine N-acetyltransferase [Clostridia bacterium]
MITIRDSTEKDLSKLMLLERECFDDPWTIEMMKGEFSRVGFCGVLAELDGEVVGYACGFSLFEDSELLKIAVRDEVRGRGIGGLILDGLTERAMALGAQRMFLEVRASNGSAIRLYASRNFAKTRIRKRYYADGEDALEMKRDFYLES